MKAVRLRNYGDVDQFKVEDLPIPAPGLREILVKVEASAVNHFDLILRQGFMAQHMPLELPATLGGDGAGTVAAVGAEVTGIQVGDRVVAHFNIIKGKGSNAEYAVATAEGVVKLPDSLSFEHGSALPFAGLTGRQAVDALGVKAGDRVLVSGALGGVGRVAVHYLKELRAIPVAGVLPEQVEPARQLAGEALDVTAVPSTGTFDYCVSAAQPAAAQIVRYVRDGGKIASVVMTPDSANPHNRVTIKMIAHHEDRAVLQAVVDAVARGALTIPVAKIFSLDQLGAAHRALAAGANGKIVLKH